MRGTLLTRLQSSVVHMVGSSSGGHVMLALALEHPEIVKTFTWVSGGEFNADLVQFIEFSNRRL